MKKPEDIKRGLVCCGMTPARQQPCKVCPYREPCIETGNHDTSVVIYDAYAYINQLEEQIANRDSLLAVMGVRIRKED